MGASTITTRFSLGDRVFHVTSDTEVIELPCRTCRGRRFLTATDALGETQHLQCPACGPTAMMRLGSWPRWRADREPLEIGMIQVKVVAPPGPENGARGDNMSPARAHRVGGHDDERYMAWSTGVGSGSLYRVEDLFPSLEEAEAEAEDRTARARAGEEVGDRHEWWPSIEQVRVASGFLDHRDVYEHDASHITLAEAIVEVAANRERS